MKLPEKNRSAVETLRERARDIFANVTNVWLRASRNGKRPGMLIFIQEETTGPGSTTITAKRRDLEGEIKFEFISLKLAVRQLP